MRPELFNRKCNDLTNLSMTNEKFRGRCWKVMTHCTVSAYYVPNRILLIK